MTKLKLGEVLDVKRGTSLPSKYYSTSGDKIRLTLGNFNYLNGGFKENTTKKDIYFMGEVKPEFILKKDDIITPLTEQVAGLLGETARIPKSNLYVQSGDIGVIVPNEELLDKNFAYYLISSPMIKKQLGAMAQQTKIRHTSPEKIKSCEAIIPKIETQKKVGRLLRYIDEEIECNNNMSKQSELIAKTIYNYWFLQFEFPNEEGKPYKSSGGKMVWNEELKREIPEGWSVEPLGELFESQSGYAFNSNEWKAEGVPVLTIKCILEDGSLDIKSASYINEKDTDKMKKYKVINGNMIFAMSGNTIGKIGIIASREKNILINQRVLILKTNVDNMAYTYFNIKNQDMQNKILQLGSNSVQPNISEQGLKKIKVCLPNSKILDKYNKICSIFFNEIISNRVENEELTKLRDYLLPLLMNGQVGFKETDK